MRPREPGVVAFTSAANAVCRFIEIAYPALLTRIQPALGISNATAGMLSGVSSLGFGSGSMASGILIDRIGVRVVIISAFAGSALMAVATAAADAPWQLAVMLTLLGVFPGLYLPAGFTLISRGAQARGVALGLHGVAGAIGRAVAPLLLVTIAMMGSWRTSYLAVAGVSGAFALFALLSVTPGDAPRDARPSASEEQAVNVETRSTAATWAPLLFVYTSFLMAGIAFRSTVTFLPKHLETHANDDLTGLFFAITLAAGAGGQMFGGVISRNGSLVRLALLVTILAVPEFLITAMLDGVLLVASAAALFFTLSMFAPIIAGLIADNAPAGGLGKSFGFGTFITTSLGAIGPAVTGVVVDEWNTGVAFAVLAAPMALSAAATLGIPRRVPGSRRAITEIQQAT